MFLKKLKLRFNAVDSKNNVCIDQMYDGRNVNWPSVIWPNVNWPNVNLPNVNWLNVN